MRLGRPVFSCSAGVRLPLLQPGAVITQQVRAGLERAGVFAVYVDDTLSEGITPVEPISAQVRDRAMRSLEDTFTLVATTGASTRIPAEQIERLDAVVKAILRDLGSRKEAVSSLMDLNAFDAHTLGHSLNVCVLGLMIGDEALRRHGWRDGRGEVRRGGIDERLEKLGTGLLLHDLGKILFPAEILRKGRFDQVFFVDLPNDEERKEILAIHMDRNQIDPSTFDLILLSSATRAWNGAEIEQAVASARITAHAKNKKAGQNDLLAAFGKTIPLSRTMEEQLKQIRSWARTRALPATSQAKPEV